MSTEFEKLQRVKDESQAIGEFLDWLSSCGIALCTWSDSQQEWSPDYMPINDRLAAYFGINLDKLDQERRAALDKFVQWRDAKSQ